MYLQLKLLSRLDQTRRADANSTSAKWLNPYKINSDTSP